MKRLMFLSIAILSTPAIMCMDKEELTSFDVCGVSYEKDTDTGSWSVSVPETVSNDDIMDRIDNTISSYTSDNSTTSDNTTDTVTTTTSDDKK